MQENNKQIIKNTKLNLPTIWTKKKLASLFLMSWLSMNGVEAGKAFDNCLIPVPLSGTYNFLLTNYIENNTFPEYNPAYSINKEALICCSQEKGCSLEASKDCIPFLCSKFNQLITCRSRYCGGIVGDDLIVKNITAGSSCQSNNYSIDAVVKYIKTIPLSDFSKNYAHHVCPKDSPCNEMTCDWDNKGWTCSINYDNNQYHSSTNCITESSGVLSCNILCLFQWSADWPGPTSLNPISTTTSSTSSLISSPTSSFQSTPLPSSSNSNTIPISVGVGTGATVIVIGGVTCYLIYKNKEGKVEVIKSPNIPQGLKITKEESNSEEINLTKEIDYQEIFHKTSGNKKLLAKELPSKLYEWKKDKVVTEKEIGSTTTYAILSYVWGDRDSKAMQKGEKGITLSANKSLAKAIRALELINQDGTDSPINYLWVDQLCMDQEDQHEKSEVVARMGKYYDNSAMTLIAIDKEVGDEKNNPSKIIEIIVNSPWFQRSWTYQEGWLSKRTIFMFDDILVDGGYLAQIWALKQLAEVNLKERYNDDDERKESSKKIATPIGWVHYKDGYSSDDKISLRLDEALRGIKDRKRTEAIDGIYSILGLLPYGSEVNVNYKKNWCSQCIGGQKLDDCQHEEKYITKYQYTEEELNEALKEVMKVAIKNGYGEVLGWHGVGSKESWLPEIDENGSTKVFGGIKIKCKKSEDIISEQGIKIKGMVFEVNSIDSIIKETGNFKSKISVGAEKTKLGIWGTEETLQRTKKGNYLLLPNKDDWKSDTPFAILLSKSEKNDNYSRLGLVELEANYEKKLKIKVKEKEIIIGVNEVIQDELEEKEEKITEQDSDLEMRIQIDPK